ncbi:MAG: tetratricopeptide repeat protein [Acidobacteriota bacterium]|nr:tetratricopeptide repeat protein [Acidobacteriota bacterium]MDH3528062.1 tetratricopeptide repeat protein [Acidobacteriota bacterium]
MYISRTDLSFRLLRRSILLLGLFALFVSFSQYASGQEDDEEFVQEGVAINQPAENTSDPVRLFLEAQEAHAKGELDKALELYAEALKAYPEFPEAEYQRGTIFQTRGSWDEAERSFRNAVQYRRDWTLAMAGLGAVLIRNGKLDEAESVLEKAIRIDGMSIPAYPALTDLYLLRPPGEEKMQRLYSSLVFLTTKANIPSSIWACRGAVERIIGKLADAKSSIDRSLALDPDNGRGKVEQIEIALAGSDFRGAVQMASTLNAGDPDDEGYQILYARALALAGDKTKAIAILEAIAEPNDQIRDLLAAIKASGEADIEVLEAELRDSPDSVPVLGRLCAALRREDPKRALGYCERAFRLDRDNIGHAIGFGAALVQLRDFRRAIDLFEDIKVRVPDNHTVRANLATAYFKSGRFADAKAEYSWITKTQPESAAGYYFLAITHDNLREYFDAMANYQQFLRLADERTFAAEIDRVRLRLPLLQRQLDKGKKGK